jgi:hypothetical protein
VDVAPRARLGRGAAIAGAEPVDLQPRSDAAAR